MTDGISTSPHCLYKSNIVDDVIINKTRQNELVKVFCEYKTEFLILFDDFFRSQDFPKPSPVLHHFFQYTHLRDAHFYRCKLIEHTVQFYFLNTKASHYLDWMFLMTEQANVFLKRLRYIKNAMKNSLSSSRQTSTRKYTHSYILLKYFMRPAEISSHFMLIRRRHKTLNIVQ